MKFLILIFFIPLSFLKIFGQNNHSKPNHIDTTAIDLNRTEYTIFRSNSMKSKIFPLDHKIIKMTRKDLINCEVLLIDFINLYNSWVSNHDSTYLFDELKQLELHEYQSPINLNLYGRQYLMVEAPNKHKIVFLNCFCNPANFKHRRIHWVQVWDGGNCFFRIKIDLTAKKIIEFSENGIA